MAAKSLRIATFGLLALLLAGCDAIDSDLINSSRPTPRPDIVAPEPETPAQSAESAALTTYYKRLENDALVRGLLRQDGGGIDTPFTDRMLAQNFQDIAFFSELSTTSNRPSAVPLQRWRAPVVMSVSYGASVPTERRQLVRSEMSGYTSRLSRVSGHPVRFGTRGNFDVFIVNEEERRALVDQLDDIGPAWADTIRDLARSDLCLVLTLGNNNRIERSIAIIRAELPDLLTRACLHEELAQGLGLSNDSPRARPSIFNDDEEFGLLTTHDELLLSILYDPRLSTGMTQTTARPIVADIAAEKFTSGSS
ncbi:MAG: DUF2927 domain-containing protein [Pseudomonadota bacterium]